MREWSLVFESGVTAGLGWHLGSRLTLVSAWLPASGALDSGVGLA